MNESEIEKYLEHAGVKGMRWGHRKTEGSSSARPTAEQIKAARAHQSVRKAAYKSAVAKGDATGAKKAADAFLKSPDRVLAAHMTKGEKIASGIMAGGLAGLRPSAASNLSNGKIAAQYVLNSYAGVLSIPLQKHRIHNIQIQQA